MTLTEAHFDFKVKSDSVSSLANETFREEQIDWLLTEASRMIVKQRIGITNNSSKGFEYGQKRKEDLRTLIVKFPEQPLIVPTNPDTDLWEVALSDLAYEYFYFVRGSVNFQKVTDATCTTSAGIRLYQNNDINKVLVDPFVSLPFDHVPGVMGRSSDTAKTKGSIYLYNTNSAEYTITGVKLEYIKYPDRLHRSAYNDIEGNVVVPNQFELPEHMHEEVVSLAVYLAQLVINNPAHPLYKEYISIME